jgi:predicted nucleic acid-binding protein
MNRVILDTDVLSEIVKDQNPTVTSRAQEYLRFCRAFTFTSTTRLEVYSGLYAKDARRQIEKFDAFFRTNDEIVPEPDDYMLAAQIIGALARRGTPVGDVDPMIAACAIRRGLPVATGNTRHYGFIIVAGFALTLENWRE